MIRGLPESSGLSFDRLNQTNCKLARHVCQKTAGIGTVGHKLRRARAVCSFEPPGAAPGATLPHEWSRHASPRWPEASQERVRLPTEARAGQGAPRAASLAAVITPEAIRYAVALDQGTTSSRAIIFDRGGRVVAAAQREHAQIYPQPGWVEHDPVEIWECCRELLAAVLAQAQIAAREVAALGIANQRETTVIWDRRSGQPVCNAIVWQDTRTEAIVAELASEGGVDRFRELTGLPPATYFSGPKARWILDHVAGARARAEAGDLLMGTVDSWLVWKLTGGTDGGLHLTDVTNASRTLMMDLRSLAWDHAAAATIGVPVSMLPEIRSCSEVYGLVHAGPLAGVPIAGVIGDQQAATFGQACFAAGEAKNTYGTGNFLVMNTGAEPVRSTAGLLSTVCYRLGEKPAVYALEGSVAVTGALVQWLRDNLGLIRTAAEVEQLAATVDDNGGLYIVPAFSGLYAPYWRPDARGVFAGLTRYVNAGHVARAALEATAFQTAEIFVAMQADTGLELPALWADGGMVANDLLMQLQADILGVPVIRPQVAETTALGAAYCAGLATGLWQGVDELRANRREDRRWLPRTDSAWRARRLEEWHRAVTRTFDWVQ